LETAVPAERPLSKIRLDRLRANGGGATEPAQAGRHRRPVNPDTDLMCTAIRTTHADADQDTEKS
jgi:hypothetical protein